MTEKIIEMFGLEGQNADIQRVQTAHRLKLIHEWGIERGARVLEIGCGQGDMSVALACHVGESGFVQAVDIANESYGEPESLGEAWARIKRT